jgi:beta-lactamase class A
MNTLTAGPILLLAAIFVAACGPVANVEMSAPMKNGPAAEAGPVPDLELQKQITEIAKEANGKVGVYAVVLDSDKGVSMNADERFAMQSVVKLPISMAVLRLSEKGDLQSDQKVAFSKEDLVPPGMRSPLREKNPNGGEAMIEDLIKLAVGESDGTASDVLQRLAGGAEGVQEYIDSLGIDGIKVRYTHREFSGDPARQYENWATPKAAVRLLEALLRAASRGFDELDKPGYALTHGNANSLLFAMTDSNNPRDRIKGLLPKDTHVAHKTGSSGTVNGVTAATNDVGIIEVSAGDEPKYLLIAVFVGDSTADEKTRDAVIARIAKAVWNKWSE